MSEQASTQQGLNCEQCRELLSEFVDQELATTEREAVMLHLQHCPKCSRESVELQGLKNFVKHWDGLKGTEQFRATAVQEFIRESQMLQSGKFTEAAQRARDEATEQEANDNKGLPKGLVLGIAALVAVLAYFLVRLLVQ